jgi:hypothetical protein
VAFGAVPGRGEDILAVVTGSAGFACCHVIHGEFTYDSFIGEGLGVAIFASVGSGMNGVAKRSRGRVLEFEDNILGFHALVTTVTVGCYSKGPFAVMAGTACSALFHLNHGHTLFLAGDDLAIMTASAGTAGFGDMDGVAECCFPQALDLERYIEGFPFVAADTVFLTGNAESFYPGMACAAGFCLFHFCHGKTFLILEAENRFMADFAVVVVFLEVNNMAEYNRFRVIQIELDVLGFGCSGADSREQEYCTRKQ